MKAFTMYSKEEVDLRLLLEKVKNYGQCNCDFQTFVKIYIEWHKDIFPGSPVSTGSANFRCDWFGSFLMYLTNYDLLEERENECEPGSLSAVFRRILDRG